QVSYEDTQTYTGQPIEPEISITFNGTLLTAEDFYVTYTSNTAVGKATATIHGIGNFTGEREVQFTIEKMDLGGGDSGTGSGRIEILIYPAWAVYSGAAQPPLVQVTSGTDPKNLLTVTEDYTVAYYEGELSDISSASPIQASDIREVGKYTIAVT